MDVGAIWSTTTQALADAYRDLVGLAVGLVEAVAVAIVAIYVGRALRRRVARMLLQARVDANVATLAGNASAVATYVIASTFALALLGASWSALLAVLGAATVAVTLALQDVLKSFVAGVYLLVEHPFTIGDTINVKGVEGTVEGIDLRTTSLRTDTGDRVLVPNATVFAEVLTNRSAAGLRRTTLTLRGITTPVTDLPQAIARAVEGLDGLASRAPAISIVGATAEGSDVAIEVAHVPGAGVEPSLVARLRERFPEASVSIGQG